MSDSLKNDKRLVSTTDNYLSTFLSRKFTKTWKKSVKIDLV